jgi:CHAP domain
MFKILKQELIFIPIMFVLIEALRWALFHFYPETALFDKGSELESFVFSFWQVTWITSASLLLLRVVMPPAYYEFKKFYNTFSDNINSQIYSIVFYLVLFFGLLFLVSGRASNNENYYRKKLVDTLNTQLHVRELTGHNDGIEIEKYLTFVNRFKGDSWCAAFVSWNLNAIGIPSPPNPKSGWSPNFSTIPYTVWSQALIKKHQAKKISPGDCFTLYYPSLGRVGHVGFIIAETNNYFITIEGNTGLTGSRDGSGVHKYKRSKSKVYRVTNYITPYLKTNPKTKTT